MSYLIGSHFIELIRSGGDLKRLLDLERRKHPKWTEVSVHLSGKSRQEGGKGLRTQPSVSGPTVRISLFLG